MIKSLFLLNMVFSKSLYFFPPENQGSRIPMENGAFGSCGMVPKCVWMHRDWDFFWREWGGNMTHSTGCTVPADTSVPRDLITTALHGPGDTSPIWHQPLHLWVLWGAVEHPLFGLCSGRRISCLQRVLIKAILLYCHNTAATPTVQGFPGLCSASTNLNSETCF